MRVLAIADRPPRPDPAVVLAQREVDLVLCLGDLQPSWLEGLADSGVPKLGVYGNHDEEPYMADVGIDDLHLRSIELGGLSFTGFEGCVRYARRGGRQYTQRQAARMARRLPPADVLICHCPPWGINDDPDDPAHIGYLALREWVVRHRPRYLLHGHTHPAPGTRMERFDDTQVIYVSGSRLLELSALQRSSVLDGKT